jgi:serine/threonine protein kinase
MSSCLRIPLTQNKSPSPSLPLSLSFAPPFPLPLSLSFSPSLSPSLLSLSLFTRWTGEFFLSFSQFAVKVVDLPLLLKSLSDFEVTAESLRESMMREIEVMARLRHRNIVQLENYFWGDQKLYICMEYVEGNDLLQCIPDGGMSEDVAKNIFFQLCAAVAFCHSQNVFLFHFPLRSGNPFAHISIHR